MLSRVESWAVLGQRVLSRVPLPPKRHKCSGLSQHTHAGGTEMLLLQPHTTECKYWLVVSPLILQPVAEAHHWYYILEMGFYMSLLLCVSVDVKRKVSVSFKDPLAHIDLKPRSLLLFPDSFLCIFSHFGPEIWTSSQMIKTPQKMWSLTAFCFFAQCNPNVVFLLLD